jgi:hypothetical protein
VYIGFSFGQKVPLVLFPLHINAQKSSEGRGTAVFQKLIYSKDARKK